GYRRNAAGCRPSATPAHRTARRTGRPVSTAEPGGLHRWSRTRPWSGGRIAGGYRLRGAGRHWAGKKDRRAPAMAATPAVAVHRFRHVVPACRRAADSSRGTGRGGRTPIASWVAHRLAGLPAARRHWYWRGRYRSASRVAETAHAVSALRRA